MLYENQATCRERGYRETRMAETESRIFHQARHRHHLVRHAQTKCVTKYIEQHLQLPLGKSSELIVDNFLLDRQICRAIETFERRDVQGARLPRWRLYRLM